MLTHCWPQSLMFSLFALVSVDTFIIIVDCQLTLGVRVITLEVEGNRSLLPL